MSKTVKTAVLTGALCSALTLGTYKILGFDEQKVIIQKADQPVALTSARYAPSTTAPTVAPFDFSYAAETSTPAVVHIRSTITSASAAQGQQQIPDVFRRFFGDDFDVQPQQRGPQQASGSGVIINAEKGYIVTNNHVVEGADQLDVTLNDQRTFPAKLIGTDPETDLAVIQVEAQSLKALKFASSDDVKIGEWVLAVGNPFNLESTVTAGIVSAKGRGIGILSRNNAQNGVSSAVESFIQTDAAVNPGNSGGALVNLNGDLIGINTAIASPTGSYAGYSFAVPSALVQKISTDLIEFGSVQRGMLGVNITTVTGVVAQEQGLKVNQGVLVSDFSANSAAKEAGLEAKDVIVAVDGIGVNNSAELQELISRRRPGDNVEITVDRDGRQRKFNVKLNARSEAAPVVASNRNNANIMEALGADFRNLTKEEKAELGVQGGVKVQTMREGKLRMETSIRPGFVITKVDRQPVTSVEDLNKALQGKSDGVLLEGIYPGSSRTYYYGLGM
ncbi:Do/DeqQ family serine protease [Catalinimonas alkaloidigena]|uniref:Do/DeqQ family serine protease n=1 Tax=Catalinimonas alkaloidigena TaxID=1075417 RepID=A0A1G8X7F5_9BACT|nr:Do family serine endopeptidase [Catalinimonas alkaloidigena]SDJ86236.1 Do/DeqQ family serine protease [Catalinimonas alkaloidigena]